MDWFEPLLGTSLVLIQIILKAPVNKVTQVDNKQLSIKGLISDHCIALGQDLSLVNYF